MKRRAHEWSRSTTRVRDYGARRPVGRLDRGAGSRTTDAVWRHISSGGRRRNVAHATASERGYAGTPLYDRQATAAPTQEVATNHIRDFEKLTERAPKLKDAPQQVTLPAAAQRGLQQSWDESAADHHAKERGGNVVRDVRNGHMTTFHWRPGTPVGEDMFIPDPDDHARDQKVIATVHTHGYKDGTENVSFSGDDLAGLVDESHNLDLMQSGKTRYMVARTSEFEAHVKRLDEDGLALLRVKIVGTWNRAFAGEGTIAERAERATITTCRQFKLAYYRGQGASLDRIV